VTINTEHVRAALQSAAIKGMQPNNLDTQEYVAKFLSNMWFDVKKTLSED